jgi:hypothetical protein
MARAGPFQAQGKKEQWIFNIDLSHAISREVSDVNSAIPVTTRRRLLAWTGCLLMIDSPAGREEARCAAPRRLIRRGFDS